MSTQPKNAHSSEQIQLENLLTLSREASITEEEMLLLLREYYERELSEDQPFPTCAKALLTAYRMRVKSESEKARKKLKAETVNEKALLISILTEKFSSTDLENCTEPIPTVERVSHIACWFSNRYSAMAYDRFKKLFSETVLLNTENFIDVCEQVSSGKCGFGILPVENSNDGRLSSFYRMLDRYELKIVAVCDVEDDNGEVFTRFALISHTLVSFPDRPSRWMEISATSANAKKMQDILCMADKLEIPITRLSSVPLYYRGNVCTDTVTLVLSEKTEFPFFVYLYLFGKDVNVLGLFIQI